MFQKFHAGDDIETPLMCLRQCLGGCIHVGYLHAALRHVDKERPERSPLLTATCSHHGNIETVVFGERDREQFELLAAWVKQVADEPKDQPPRTIAPGSSNLLQASYDQPTTEPDPINGEAPSTVAPTGARSIGSCEGRKTDPGTGYLPRDPFDPEIFNRRFQLRSQ